MEEEREVLILFARSTRLRALAVPFYTCLDGYGESAMKRETRFYLVVVCVIVLFDVAGSFASRALKFDYTHLAWISRFLYAVAGYFGFAHIRLAGVLLAGLVAGVADATIGWALSAAIGPYLPVIQPPFTFGLVAIVIVIVSLEAAFFGLIGGLSHLLLSRLQKRP
jgi:hypothetical protein